MKLLVSGATKTMRQLLPHPNLGILLTPQIWGGVKMVRRLGASWACDNSAYSNWCPAKFLRMCADVIKTDCLWVSVPDVVGDALETVKEFMPWSIMMRHCGIPLAFVAQDDMQALQVPWHTIDCLFLGGTDDWKFGRHAVDLCLEAKQRGKWVHVGRVNSFKRIEWAMHECQADSIDGSSTSMFPDTYIKRFLDFIRAEKLQRRLAWEGTTGGP